MLKPNSKGFIKNAIFLSHSSLKDFLSCPQAYYFKNLYRDPATGHKLQIASPYLTLGSTIHETIDWFYERSSEGSLHERSSEGSLHERSSEGSLHERSSGATPHRQDFKPSQDQILAQFRHYWRNYRLKRGGFESLEEEASFGKRGLAMLPNFYQHYLSLDPHIPAVRFPKYNLLEDVILTGNMDYVGRRPDGSFSVVDFKTGAKDEMSQLQLNIYAILTEANMGQEVTQASFWYLDRDDLPKPVVLDPVAQTLDWLTERAKEVKAAVLANHWVCKKHPGLCKDCRNYQLLIDKKAEFLFSDFKFKKDFYFLKAEPKVPEDEASVSED